MRNNIARPRRARRSAQKFIYDRARRDPLAEARVRYRANKSGFAALGYAARISDARGRGTAADRQMALMFEAAAKANPCHDCFHPECEAVGKLMATAYEMIEQHERSKVMS